MIDKEFLTHESLNFIAANITATGDKIPLHLLNHWLEPGPDKRDPESTHHWEIFMYALLQYHKNKEEFEFQIGAEDLQDLYIGWQVFLAVLQLTFFTKIVVRPFKIFDFDNYKKMQLKMKSEG